MPPHPLLRTMSRRSVKRQPAFSATTPFVSDMSPKQLRWNSSSKHEAQAIRYVLTSQPWPGTPRTSIGVHARPHPIHTVDVWAWSLDMNGWRGRTGGICQCSACNSQPPSSLSRDLEIACILVLVHVIGGAPSPSPPRRLRTGAERSKLGANSSRRRTCSTVHAVPSIAPHATRQCARTPLVDDGRVTSSAGSSSTRDVLRDSIRHVVAFLARDVLRSHQRAPLRPLHNHTVVVSGRARVSAAAVRFRNRGKPV